MELRISFVNPIRYALVFAIIAICKANYDAQQLGQLKSLEYGEKLTSLEEGQWSLLKGNSRTNVENEVIPVAQKRSSWPETMTARGESTPWREVLKPRDKSLLLPSTRCTTSKPLPKLSPWFLPNENNTDNNNLNSEGSSRHVTNKKYLAPTFGETPKHYIDDE